MSDIVRRRLQTRLADRRKKDEAKYKHEEALLRRRSSALRVHKWISHIHGTRSAHVLQRGMRLWLKECWRCTNHDSNVLQLYEIVETRHIQSIPMNRHWSSIPMNRHWSPWDRDWCGATTNFACSVKRITDTEHPVTIITITPVDLWIHQDQNSLDRLQNSQDRLQVDLDEPLLKQSAERLGFACALTLETHEATLWAESLQLRQKSIVRKSLYPVLPVHGLPQIVLDFLLLYPCKYYPR
jgi:hypothetical protein